MATLPTNQLQVVQTYNDAMLGNLQNQNPFIPTLNHEFKEFNEESKNLGDTINLALPYRARSGVGLVATFQGTKQRLQSLVCDQAAHVAHAYSDQDFIFNVKQYMEQIGKSRVAELASLVGETIAKDATSSVPVMDVDDNGQSVPTGALHTESGPFLFYGNGEDNISTFGDLARMAALQRNFGAPNGPLSFYLPDTVVPDIVNTGLSQFVPSRNEDIANSWDLGEYKGSNSRYYSSNLLPVHFAGTSGVNGDTLTLVSTNDPTGQNITQLTFSGVTQNVGAIKSGDLFEFNDGVSGRPDIRYLTFTGHTRSNNKVQFRATADADATAGTVTVSIYPALVSAPTQEQNLSNALQAGMQVSVMKSHRAGLLVSGNAWFLAMPTLPDQDPFKTVVSVDKETKVSLRTYWGNRLAQNFRGIVTDAIWASTLVPEYCRRICFPL